jgi:hypothetical protein
MSAYEGSKMQEENERRKSPAEIAARVTEKVKQIAKEVSREDEKVEEAINLLKQVKEGYLNPMLKIDKAIFLLENRRS